MNTKRIILLSFLLLVVLILSIESRALNRSLPKEDIFKSQKRDWNVLLITIDTLRTDRVSVYSDEHLKTPHIDGLAAKGVVFTRAFAHNPLTLASHINILTGATPLHHGISDNAGYRLDDRFLTIAEHLKEKGYSTGAFVGAFPLDSRFGMAQGFDVYDDDYGTKNPMEFFYVERPAGKVIDPTLDWLDGQKGKWFCWVHLFDPHQPYLPPEPYREKYKNDLYSGEVSYVDDELGRLFDFLQEKQGFDATCVILTGDHGEGLGDHGESTHSYFAYNSTIHIPLILFAPGLSARTIHTNVCHVDIFPTICDILGDSVPNECQGESLIPIINGKDRKRTQIYFESMSPYLNRGWAPLKGYIKEDLKYINLPIQEVYKLDSDFEEKKNLAGDFDLRKFKQSLQALERDLSSQRPKSRRSRKMDEETLARLRSLGYVVGSPGPKKTSFTEADDLKTLLPLQSELEEAMALYHKGYPDKAFSVFQGIISKSKTFVMAYTFLANMYQQKGKITEAVELLKQGMADNPDNVAIMSKLGIMQTEANQAREAVEILERCVQIEDFNPEYWNYLGVAHYKSGNFRKALDAYNRALELDEDYALAHNNIGSLYLVVYLQKNERSAYDLAVMNFKKAIELDPRLASAYNGLGVAYKKAGRADDAIILWKKSLEFQPGFAFPLYNLGLSYLAKGEKSTALTYFEKYKVRVYESLTREEKQKLDQLIERCKNK